MKEHRFQSRDISDEGWSTITMSLDELVMGIIIIKLVTLSLIVFISQFTFFIKIKLKVLIQFIILFPIYDIINWNFVIIKFLLKLVIINWIIIISIINNI